MKLLLFNVAYIEVYRDNGVSWVFRVQGWSGLQTAKILK